MKWIHGYDFFLFDFDGLLVDTESLHFAAYVELCRAHGFELGWSFKEFCEAAHFHALGLRDAIRRDCPGLGGNWDELYAEKKRIYEGLLGEVKLMPGAEALLGALQAGEVRHCVVTNSTRKQVEMIAAGFDVLKRIPLWVTREDYERPKPAPDGYRKAIELLGQDGDRMIGFEDSKKGLTALLAAEVKGVLICPADHPQVAECAGVAHFESLLDVV